MKQHMKDIIWIDPINTDAQFLNLMADALSRTGLKVTVCSIKRASYLPRNSYKWIDFSSIELSNYKIASIIQKIFIGILYPLFWIRVLIWIFSKRQKRVIISSSLKIPFLDTIAMTVMKRMGIRTNVICHKPHPNFFERNGRSYARKYKGYYLASDKIHVMTNYTKNLLAIYFRLPRRKIYLFKHPGFNLFLKGMEADKSLLNKIRDWKGNDNIVAYLSSLSMEHNFEGYLKCIEILSAKAIGIKYMIIVGNADLEGRAEHSIRMMMNKFKIDEEKCFIWATRYNYAELLSFLNCIDVVVLPYIAATQSGIIPLVNVFGIPVVATDAGGLSEMIRNGRNGEIVDKDNIEKMANVIEKVLSRKQDIMYRKGIISYCKECFGPEDSANMLMANIENIQ